MTVWLEMSGRLRKVELAGGMGCGLLDRQPEEAASFRVDDRKVEANVRMLQQGVVSVLHEGRQYRCVADGDAVVVEGGRYEFAVADPRSLARHRGVSGAGGGARAVKAPMPGRVVRLLVEVGDLVEEQQGLVAIEAMKMQNELKSPKPGKVSRIAVAVGDTVAAGDVLVVVE